ncbi:Putative universal stress protein [Aquicella siphonis]|uniref:Universal stress protein n=1 Tax=Aquicella siphonis TaxID=254247 RepID=A0A5E4PGZ4_9COXI|nr:universal stress protein [Aquicella siphonis]VVC75623.1 Putative universal stress protein [Aquicella siphonis]
MYAKILVPVDGSETSETAMSEAVKLAKDQGAKISVIYIADEYLAPAEGITIDFNRYETSMREYGLSLLHKMEEMARAAQVPVEGKLIEISDYSDHVPEKIIDEARNGKADLIVIGTHGRRGFRRLLLGSVAEGVVRLAHIPVLLIRARE